MSQVERETPAPDCGLGCAGSKNPRTDEAVSAGCEQRQDCKW